MKTIKQPHVISNSLKGLINLILVGLFYAVLAASNALAMSPPPPEPSPEPIIPQIDPIPGTPNLSIDLSQTEIRLSWYATQDAEYYPVYAYAGGQWRQLEDISGTATYFTHSYDYETYGWDISELQLKILACKAKPAWLAFFWWEYDRCSDYSNTVKPMDQLSQVGTALVLSSYPRILQPATVAMVASTATASQPDNPADPLGAVRYIEATLRLKNRNTGESQDIHWPIDLDANNFTIISDKTIVVERGIYNAQFLATDGDVQYVASATNITLDQGYQTIPLELKSVLDNSMVTIDSINQLPELKFQYDSEDLQNSAHPVIGVKIDNGYEKLLTFNPELGVTDQYIPNGNRQIQIELKAHNGKLLNGLSRPEQENRTVIANQPLAMDLMPLVGNVTMTLTGDTATLRLSIPRIGVVDEVLGDYEDFRATLSLSGVNNQADDIALGGFTYNANSDAYEVQHTYSGMGAGSEISADSQIALSWVLTNANEPNQWLGRCVADNLVLDNITRSAPCRLTLHRRAIAGSHLLTEIDINVFDLQNVRVKGAAVYAKHQGAQGSDSPQGLGTLLGLTGSGTLGTAGYLRAYLPPGDYQITVVHTASNTKAQDTVTLSPFNVNNHDVRLNPQTRCQVNTTGLWVVTESCTLEGIAIAPASVLVEEDVTLTIASNGFLNIDFANHELKIRRRGQIYMHEGGRIQ